MDLALWGIFSGLILVPGSIDVGGYCWLDLLSRRDLSSLPCLVAGLAGSDTHPPPRFNRFFWYPARGWVG